MQRKRGNVAGKPKKCFKKAEKTSEYLDQWSSTLFLVVHLPLSVDPELFKAMIRCSDGHDYSWSYNKVLIKGGRSQGGWLVTPDLNIFLRKPVPLPTPSYHYPVKIHVAIVQCIKPCRYRSRVPVNVQIKHWNGE